MLRIAEAVCVTVEKEKAGVSAWSTRESCTGSRSKPQYESLLPQLLPAQSPESLSVLDEVLHERSELRAPGWLYLMRRAPYGPHTDLMRRAPHGPVTFAAASCCLSSMLPQMQCLQLFLCARAKHVTAGEVKRTESAEGQAAVASCGLRNTPEQLGQGYFAGHADHLSDMLSRVHPHLP